VGAVNPDHVPCELRDGAVQAQADAEIRDLPLAGDAAGKDLALPPARAEAAGDEHAVNLLELAAGLFERHALRVDPPDLDEAAVVDACVLERLWHGEVRVVEVYIPADK